jgi:hypothetical protein
VAIRGQAKRRRNGQQAAAAAGLLHITPPTLSCLHSRMIILQGLTDYWQPRNSRS